MKGIVGEDVFQTNQNLQFSRDQEGLVDMIFIA